MALAGVPALKDGMGGFARDRQGQLTPKRRSIHILLICIGLETASIFLGFLKKAWLWRGHAE
jgi:hypothetical protein